MMKMGSRRFCAVACVLKRLVKCLLNLWFSAVEYYLWEYESLCNALKFWPHLIWLALRTRGYVPARYDRDGWITEGNEYIDTILKDMYEDGGYDPYEFQDISKRFDKTIALIDINGKAEVKDVYVTGLKTLRRVDHASLKQENGQLKLKAELGVGELNFYCWGMVKLANVGPTYAFKGKIGYLEVHMEFSLDPETGRNGRLNELVIYYMRDVHVQTSIHKYFDWIPNKIISLALKIFRRFFHNLIEIEVENYIRESIRNFQFPLYTILEGEASGNQESTVEPAKTAQEPTVTQVSNEQIADATENSERKSKETDEKTREETKKAADTSILKVYRLEETDLPVNIKKTLRFREPIECSSSDSSSSSD